MAGKRVAFGADAPHVEIVYVVHSLNFTDGCFNVLQLHSPRSAFQQDVQSFTNDAESRPEDQSANPKGQRGVNPILARKQDNQAADDDSGGRKCVPNFVKKGATNIHVTAATVQQKRDDSIHDYAGS